MKNLITYGTHLPVLVRAITDTMATEIMELGGGLSSTPLLNQFAMSSLAHIKTYENNPDFFELIKEFDSDEHDVNFIENWDEIPLWVVDVLFVDHAPAERRIIDIERFKDAAKVIVVHDFEKKKYYGYDKIIPLFKYVTEYKYYPKTTGVLSNFVDVTKWFK